MWVDVDARVGVTVTVSVDVGISVGISVGANVDTGKSVGCCTCVTAKIGLGTVTCSGFEGLQEDSRKENAPRTNIQ